MSDPWSAIAALAALCAAAAASFAAWFTYQIMRSGQKQVDAALRQVEVSQQEVGATLDAQQNAQLPVLMPAYQLVMVGHASKGPTGAVIQSTQAGYDHNQPYVRVQVRNVGPGLALNIRGIVFGPRPDYETARVTSRGHAQTFPTPLTTSAEFTHEWEAGGAIVNGDTKIGSYTLYAPTRPSADEKLRGVAEMVARLTLTYADIYGRKHAAIYDLTEALRWVEVAYIPNIPQDLGDLERAALMDIPIFTAPSYTRVEHSGE